MYESKSGQLVCLPLLVQSRSGNGKATVSFRVRVNNVRRTGGGAGVLDIDNDRHGDGGLRVPGAVAAAEHAAHGELVRAWGGGQRNLVKKNRPQDRTDLYLLLQSCSFVEQDSGYTYNTYCNESCLFFSMR